MRRSARGRGGPASAATCARSGGSPGCSAASTTRSTPARRASGGTACSPTCPSSAWPVVISPSARDCAAPPRRPPPSWTDGSAARRVLGREIRVDLTSRRGAVHGDEVDAGHALVQQGSAQLGGDLDAERADGGLVLGAVAVECGEPVGEVGGERLTGELDDPGDLFG